MDIAIIVSTKDQAGMNIRSNLAPHFTETEEEYDRHRILEKTIKDNRIRLVTTDKNSIDCEHIDKELPSDLIIFATKHQSAAGIPSLSVHSPGNWGNAEMGGKDNFLCTAPPNLLRHALFKLEEKAKEMEQEIVQECTHHGPALDCPVMFIEIGSSEVQWTDPKAGDIIAQTILELLDEINIIPKHKIAFGIGGPHHCPQFTRAIHRTDLAFGHICPKYMLTSLTKKMIEQAIQKPKADIVVLDWKGLSSEKRRIKDILDSLKIPYERTNRL
ncbi:MAG: D-aminoacyl-tRNA deacylase [Candidatus Nanoarchaeia archaeon]